MSEVINNRSPLQGVSPLFYERWSPRAFDSGEIDEATLSRLIDAARWSPSCMNEQPWLIYTSTKNTFNDYLGLLMETNQVWAKTASVIGFMVGRKQFEKNGKDNPFQAFDCGAAWMAMTLQARHEGLYTHGMGGIKREAIVEYLDLNGDSQAVLMGFTIGRLGDPKQLSEEMRAIEKPSQRKALDQIWFR